jgi:hypothetical protein
MNRRSVFFMLAQLGCAALLASCDDDPTEPQLNTLEEVPLVGLDAEGAFLDIAFSGTLAIDTGTAVIFRGLAVGSVASGVAPNQTFVPLAASLNANGSWASDPSINLPSTGLLTAVAMTSSDLAVIAGVDLSALSGFILDERNGWSQHNVAVGGLAFAVHDDTLRVAGASGTTQQVMISTAPDSWTLETVPYSSTGQNERQLQDLSARGGRWVACGFDDAGDGTPDSPNNVLFLNQGAGWERISVSCGGCSNREFRSVAASETGGVLLGGAVTDFTGGANEYTASLLVRSVSGDWAPLTLPAPTELKRVNDILIAQDGTVYLACGLGTTSYLVRSVNGDSMVRDATVTKARINRLAESPDGSIWAAGAVLDAEGNVLRPAIWKRTS